MAAPAQVPDDVILEILLRLPATDIARCRQVCRAWRSAVADPSFDRAHSAKRPAAAARVAAQHEVSYHGFLGSPRFRVTRIVAFDFFLRGEHGAPLLRPRALCFSSPQAFTMLVGSFDGVVCLKQGILQGRSRYDNVPREALFGFYVYQFVLWNPVAMTCAIVCVPGPDATVGVPGPDHRRHLGHIIGGYAHPETRRFHLLHASGETNGGFRISPTPFRILSVGDDAAWRELPFLLGEEDTFPEIIMGKGNVVRLHDNLHWLAQPSSSSSRTMMQLRVLVFDTTRQKFWLMETVPAEERRGGPLMCLWLARLGVISKKLCIFAVEPSSSTMELWVLDGCDSGGATPRGSWRLEARISLITWDGFDLSRAFSPMAEVQVEVVEDDDVEEGEEEVLIKQMEGRIDSYNVRHKAWGDVGNLRTSFMAHESMVMHRESLVQGQVSFGKATRSLRKYFDYYGQRLYCL